MKQTVLVTGGAGFIGSHVVDTLLEADYEVAVVDDLSTGKIENIPSRAAFYQLDIRKERLKEIFQVVNPDYVSHQAARANVRESLEKPVLYADVNLVGSVNLLECCRRYEVKKIIYASTSGAVYGEPERLPVDESHPIRPLDPYGASKHHVEHHLHICLHNFSLQFTTLRYPNVYGPRQDPHGEAGVVAIFASRMLDNEGVTINGSGEQARDFVYVGDVARANLLALKAGECREYNLGTGSGTSVNQLFRELQKLTDYLQDPHHGPPKQGEVFKIALDSEAAQRDLGWRAEVSLEEGLARTVASFRPRS